MLRFNSRYDSALLYISRLRIVLAKSNLFFVVILAFFSLSIFLFSSLLLFSHAFDFWRLDLATSYANIA